MDSFQFRGIKIAKSHGILNFHGIRVIANVFRFVEILIFLVLISKVSARIPLALKILTEFFKEFILMIMSPRFVFVIGNVIVITLFAKSGRYSNQDSTSKTSNLDLYQEFVEKSEKKQGIEQCEIENRGKQSIGEVLRYQRSKSENFRVDLSCEDSNRKLKRSKTEKLMRICDSEKKIVKFSSYPEDCMSNEEFRNKIEAFIARQKRLQKDEEYFVI